MKSTLRFSGAVTGSMLVLASLANAQTPAPAPVSVAPPLMPAWIAPVPTFTEPGSVNLESANGLQPFHMSGEVGAGIYSIHGAGPGSLLGTNASVNILGEHLGAGVNWFEASQTTSRSGSWGFAHHP
jgi:hypothetical protein